MTTPDICASMRSADNGNGTFTNPVIFADYPDPDIIRVKEDYYLVSSSFTDSPGVPVCHSKDLVNWKIIGHAYDQIPSNNPAYDMANGETMYRGGSWAPCIRHHRGKFYVCFNIPQEGFFMFISERPEGPYEKHGFGGKELYDPGLFFDEDDRVYVAHGANDLYLTELAADAKSVSGPSRFLYSTSYGTPLEGAHMYKRGGYYYIFNTTRGYNGIQMVYRSRDLLGPYEHRVICGDDMNYHGAGLHQGGFVDSPDGQSWLFLFQDRDYVGRTPVLLPLRWEDDWPVVGDLQNFGRVQVTSEIPVPGAEGTHQLEGSDDFEDTSLHARWHWNHHPDSERWSLQQRPGWIRLASGPATGLMNARNTLTQKITGNGCMATTKMDFSGLRPGDVAGLCLLGVPHAYIAVESHQTGIQLVMVNEGTRVASIGTKANVEIYFRAEANRAGVGIFSFSNDGKEFYPLGNELIMGFSPKTFLGNKFGLFCFNIGSETQKGYADFDFFRYDCSRLSANHFSAFERIWFSDYDKERGTRTQRVVEKQPHRYLADVHDGDWLRFDHIDFRNGATAFEVLAATVQEGGSIELRLGSLDGQLIGKCILPASKAQNQWQAVWHTYGTKVQAVSGVQTLYAKFVGGDGVIARLDWFSFKPISEDHLAPRFTPLPQTPEV